MPGFAVLVPERLWRHSIFPPPNNDHIMQLIDLLSPERVIACDAKISNKRKLLARAASLVATGLDGVAERSVFDGFFERERLGSTALGGGVAIPHCRIDSANVASAACLKLLEPIRFEAPDDQGVDLVFALAVPGNFTDQHLKLLSNIATVLSEPSAVEMLRSAKDSAQLYAALTETWCQFGGVKA
ncbi:MAG: PTS IIA-like nitrogen-regulatory protein PtsN [Lysobacteraceae bacterium]|nr:MAG: PTS IIA-like nitrogen-regulatory protein PtsN [Xanthomonadaceae bacterium]